MPGYQDTQLPLHGGFGAADPSAQDGDNGPDPQPDILSGVTDTEALDGNDGLDLPAGPDFGEQDPQDQEDFGGSLRDTFRPKDDSFDEPLPEGSGDGLYGDGWDRLLGGTDTDGHDSSEADEPDAGGDFGAETIFGGLDGDDIDGIDPLPDEPDLGGDTELSLPTGPDFGELDPSELEDPDFGEVDPSALESRPESDPEDDLTELGGGIGEDSLLGGGIDPDFGPAGGHDPDSNSPSGGASKDIPGGNNDGAQSGDGDQVNFDATKPPDQDMRTVEAPVVGPLTAETLLDVGSDSVGLGTLLGNLGGPDTAGAPGASAVPLVLTALGTGLEDDTATLISVEILA